MTSQSDVPRELDGFVCNPCTLLHVEHQAPSYVRLPLLLFLGLATCQPPAPTSSTKAATEDPTRQSASQPKADDPPVQCRVHSVELIAAGAHIVAACRAQGVVLKTLRVNEGKVLGQRSLSTLEWERVQAIVDRTPWSTVANCTIDESESREKQTLVIAKSETHRRRFHCSGLPRPLGSIADVLTDLASVSSAVRAPGAVLPTLDRLAPPQDCTGWTVRLEHHQKHGSEMVQVRCVRNIVTITSEQSASPNDYAAVPPRRVSRIRWQSLWSQLAKAGWNRLPDCVVEQTDNPYLRTSITIQTGVKRQRRFVCHGGRPPRPHWDLVQAIDALRR